MKKSQAAKRKRRKRKKTQYLQAHKKAKTYGISRDFIKAATLGFILESQNLS